MESIEQHLQEVIGAAENGNTDLCITLEAEKDLSRWLQLTWDSLNFAYPLAAAPADGLAGCGLDVPGVLELTGWEAGTYVTFAHGADPIPAISQFVDLYLRQVLDLDVRAHPVTVTREIL
jgi:hypothetical protein